MAKLIYKLNKTMIIFNLIFVFKMRLIYLVSEFVRSFVVEMFIYVIKE